MIRSALSLAEAVSMSLIRRAHGAVSCVTWCTESSVAHVFTALSLLAIGTRDGASAMLVGPATCLTLKLYA